MLSRPEKDEPDNQKFNYWVSRVCVKSEHCVGFLKGRFCSLRGLHIQINQAEHLQIAALWIIACIAVHSFAMTHEAGNDVTADAFFQKASGLLRRRDCLEKLRLMRLKKNIGKRLGGRSHFFRERLSAMN